MVKDVHAQCFTCFTCTLYNLPRSSASPARCIGSVLASVRVCCAWTSGAYTRNVRKTAIMHNRTVISNVHNVYIYIHLLALFNRWWCIDYTIAAGSEHYRSHSYHTQTHNSRTVAQSVCGLTVCVFARLKASRHILFTSFIFRWECEMCQSKKQSIDFYTLSIIHSLCVCPYVLYKNISNLIYQPEQRGVIQSRRHIKMRIVPIYTELATTTTTTTITSAFTAKIDWAAV